MGTFEKIRQLSPWAMGIFAFTFIAFMILGDIGSSTSGMAGQNERQEIALIDGEPIYLDEYETKIREISDAQRRSNPEGEINDNLIRATAWQQLVDQTIIRNQANELGYYVSKDPEFVSIIREELLENPPAAVRQGFVDSLGNFDSETYKRLVQYYDTDAQAQAQQIIDSDQYTEEQKRQILQSIQQQVQSTTMQILNVENMTIQNLLTSGLQNVVNAAGGVVSPTYAKHKYKMDNSTADVTFITFPASSISDEEVEIDDSEMLEYYNKNKQFYDKPEMANVIYAVFPISPSTEDLQSNDRKISDLTSRMQNAGSDSLKKVVFMTQRPTSVGYTLIKDLDADAARFVADAEIGQIVGPARQPNGTFYYMVDDRREGTNEVVKAKHILVNFNDNKDSALVVAKDIKNQVNTSNFADKARELSQDRGSARSGGDLGYFGKNQMVQPFEEAAFGAAEGSIVGPIESSFGYHIIYVEDKTSDEVSYSYIQFEPKVTKKTKQMIAAKANSLIQSLKKGDAFDSTAIQLGANINTLPRLTRQQKVLGRQSITNDLFENETGYITPAVLVEGQGFVVAQLVDKIPAGPAPFETVENEIRPNLIKQKKMEMLAEKANDIYSQLKDKPVISDVANIDPSLPLNSATDATLNGNIPGAGKDFALSGAIMSAEIGKISGPVYGDNALYIIQVTDRYIPSEEQIEENLPTYYENLVGQQKSSNFYQWYSDYKTKMNLEDYRSRNYREF